MPSPLTRAASFSFVMSRTFTKILPQKSWIVACGPQKYNIRVYCVFFKTIYKHNSKNNKADLKVRQSSDIEVGFFVTLSLFSHLTYIYYFPYSIFLSILLCDIALFRFALYYAFHYTSQYSLTPFLSLPGTVFPVPSHSSASAPDITGCSPLRHAPQARVYPLWQYRRVLPESPFFHLIPGLPQ